VKDNEMKVAVAAESIVREENHEYYVWILQCMAKIEPCFELSNVWIIFADQKITVKMSANSGRIPVLAYCL
jgi:hypothetical protein